MKLTSRLQLWIALMLVIIAVLIAACSDKPSIPDLSSWLGKAETPYNFVKLEEGVFAVLVKNADGKVDRIVLTRSSDVILSLELYGNGQSISIASDGSPELLVQQGRTGLDVSRYIRNKKGSFRQVFYGPDGSVSEEHDIDQTHCRP